MNADLLSCKREAVAMTLLEQPPLDGNGRKKGYIRIMSELWDAKGYGDLGFSSQNLRDQAARTEKTLEETQKTYRGRHRRMQIHEFSITKTCLWMHKSEQTRQALLLCP